MGWLNKIAQLPPDNSPQVAKIIMSVIRMNSAGVKVDAETAAQMIESANLTVPACDYVANLMGISQDMDETSVLRMLQTRLGCLGNAKQENTENAIPPESLPPDQQSPDLGQAEL